jgi:hypothetical protein
MRSFTRRQVIVAATLGLVAAPSLAHADLFGGDDAILSGILTQAIAEVSDLGSTLRPLRLVQQKLGLRMLSHLRVGRHSVASQAVTSGESVKAAQAQLGHRSEQSTHQYAHLGSGAQRRLVAALQPSRAPHETANHVNVASTDTAIDPLREGSRQRGVNESRSAAWGRRVSP